MLSAVDFGRARYLILLLAFLSLQAAGQEGQSQPARLMRILKVTLARRDSKRLDRRLSWRRLDSPGGVQGQD